MARKGLGRGLESLMGEANAEVHSNKPDVELPIESISPNPHQPRKDFDQDKLEELKSSIEQHGILQPILVRKRGNKYQIVAGERRYQAAKLAGLKRVPVVVRDISDKEVFELALIENLQRTDLNPIEEAQGYKELLDQNDWTQEELAHILSKSRSTITNAVRLLDLPKEVQDYMASGQLTAGHARAILAVPNKEDRIKLADKVVQEKLSVRQTENLATLISVNKSPKPKRQPTPENYKRAAHILGKVLNTKVRVRRKRGKNKIEIDFKDEDDLTRLVSELDQIQERGE